MLVFQASIRSSTLLQQRKEEGGTHITHQVYSRVACARQSIMNGACDELSVDITPGAAHLHRNHPLSPIIIPGWICFMSCLCRVRRVPGADTPPSSVNGLLTNSKQPRRCPTAENGDTFAVCLSVFFAADKTSILSLRGVSRASIKEDK